MARHLFKCLLVWAAFAMMTLASLGARAAILPACETGDVATLMPLRPAPLAFLAPDDDTPSCAEGAAAADDPAADVKVAAICDPRGASAIAPQRVLPVSDARIEMGPSCGRLDLSTQHIGPSSHEGNSVGPAALLVDPALVAATNLVPPALYELAPAFPPVIGAAHSGAPQSIYHPPR